MPPKYIGVCDGGVSGIPGAVSSARAVDSPAASEDPAPAEESDDGSGSTEDAVAVTEGPSGDGSASMASSKVISTVRYDAANEEVVAINGIK